MPHQTLLGLIQARQLSRNDQLRRSPHPLVCTITRVGLPCTHKQRNASQSHSNNALRCAFLECRRLYTDYNNVSGSTSVSFKLKN
jgi:hypothetical protein